MLHLHALLKQRRQLFAEISCEGGGGEEEEEERLGMVERKEERVYNARETAS